MIQPGAVWRDLDGIPIQAHGGGVLYDGGVYYWFGENKDAPNASGPEGPLGRVDIIGVSCYSSRNLSDWKNEGVVLPAVPNDPAHDLHPSRVAERPKVIYNARMRQYVMWLHIDDSDYAYARTGRAVSASPTGPYQYIGSIRPADAESRDMTVFQDADGAAYLYHSSDGNKTLRISRLTDDFLDLADPVAEAFVGRSREAPAVFRHGSAYVMVTSGCSGWEPNAAEYAVAATPLGPWNVRGNPCLGPGAETTFGGQSTFVLPVAGLPGAFILMLDRWQPQSLRDSRYAWLPMEWDSGGMRVLWRESWDPSSFSPVDGATRTLDRDAAK